MNLPGHDQHLNATVSLEENLPQWGAAKSQTQAAHTDSHSSIFCHLSELVKVAAEQEK